MKQKYTPKIIAILSGIAFFIINVSVSMANEPESSTYYSFAKSDIQVDTLDVESLDPVKGIAIFGKKLVVFSNSAMQQKMLASHISFVEEGSYLADAGDLNDLPYPALFKKTMFPNAPGGMVFSEDQNIVYYSTPDPDNSKRELIYSAAFSGEGEKSMEMSKSAPIPMKLFDGNYSCKQPAISNDNTFMVFASDGPGSLGGLDLFVVSIEGNTNGTPQHLGINLNTKKDECYPFLDADNNLYFSSAGHAGHGGLDVYMCKYTGNGWEAPVNLTRKINSPGDEISYRVAGAGNTAYFVTAHSENNEAGSLIKLSTSAGTLVTSLLEEVANEYEFMYDEAFTFKAEKRVTLPEMLASKVKVQAKAEATEQIPVQVQASPKIEENNTRQSEEELAAERRAAEQQAADRLAAEQREAERLAAEQREAERKAAEEREAERLAAEQWAAERRAANERAAAEEQARLEAETKKDEVIFRVQITSSRSSSKGKVVKVAGKEYTVFEYNYKGAYRQTVGAFRDLDDAKAFQSACRSSGFSQAFVAAFVNDERVTDPAVFKR